MNKFIAISIMTLPEVIAKIFQLIGLKVEDMMCKNVFIVHHKLVKSTHQLHYLHNTITMCISNTFYLSIRVDVNDKLHTGIAISTVTTVHT